MSIFIQTRTRAKIQRQNTHIHQKAPLQRMKDLGTYWKVMHEDNGFYIGFIAI